jgi:WD40 repeat protein
VATGSAEIAVAPDGSWFAAALEHNVHGVDFQVLAGSVGDAEQVSLRGHQVRIKAIAAAGDWLVSADYQGNVRVWDRPKPGHGRSPYPNDQYAMGVAFSPDGRRVLVSDRDGVRPYDVATGTSDIATGTSDVASETVASSTGDEPLIASHAGWRAHVVRRDREIRVYSLDGDQENPSHVLPGYQIGGLALSPDESRLACCGDGVIRVWDTRDWTCETMLRTHAYLHRCAWSPDGSRLAVTGELGVYLFDLRR